MPISTNTSIDFASSTGYTVYERTPGDVVFTAGTCKLDTGVVDTAAVRTPTLDTSAWTAIQGVAPTCTDAYNYEHKFLVSFEDWATATAQPFWYSYLRGVGWYTVARYDTDTDTLLDQVSDVGLGRYQLASIRDWPVTGTGTRLTLLVGMTRNTGGGNGSIDLLTVSYGTEVVDVVTAETSIGTLAFTPDFHPPVQFGQTHDPVPFSGGYTQEVELATKLRRRIQGVQWSALTGTEKDTLLAFLKSGMNTHFSYQFYGDTATRKWKVEGIPSVKQAGVKDRFNITANLMEHFE